MGGLPSTVQRVVAASAPSSTWSRSTMSTFTRGMRTETALDLAERHGRRSAPPTSASSRTRSFSPASIAVTLT
jgi:hypothetical protein